MLSHGGAFITKTGKYTGRSPKDRFVVKEASSKDQLWWGEVNQPISEEKFDSLFLRLLSYWQGRDLFLQDYPRRYDNRHHCEFSILLHTPGRWLH